MPTEAAQHLEAAQEERDPAPAAGVAEIEDVVVKATGLEDDPDTHPVPGSPPLNLNTTRRIGNRLYVAGRGDREKAEIMFIATSVLEEEASESQMQTRGQMLKQKPRYLKGPAGSIFADLCMSVGIMLDAQYYTAACKWLLPKATRLRPKRDELAWALPTLRREIQDVAPKIIVCLGKPAFDLVCPGYKLPLADIQGAWFYAKDFNARVYVMGDITRPVAKPEYVEAYRIDLLEVRKMWDKVRGLDVPQLPTDYRTITDSQQLTALVAKLIAEERIILSVDCEWMGNNHVAGKLRSLQICWESGNAAYLRFMDDEGNYVFDVDYREAGEILATWLDEPEVKYVGHHIAADLPWMSQILGLQWFDKTIFDTEFGQQVADEYEGLGLERMAMKYTDLGRYDIDLTLWKKEHKLGPCDGYGFVPDEILIPYACKDVDVVMRTYPILMGQLVKQGLLDYYYDIFQPMAADVFTHFALLGLPMNIPRMDELRDLFLYARGKLSAQLQEDLVKESQTMLFRALYAVDPETGPDVFLEIDVAEEKDQAYEVFKKFIGAERLADLQPIWDHYLTAPGFNIRSGIHMRRWLFEVKKLTPVKSTNNKEKGLPSVPWEKVLNLPESRQKEYTPSTDKQTLQIYGSDPMISQLLELNAVGNVVKAFLKPADIDEDTGELIKENGLHFWLAPDGRIHGQYSTTESGRPRSWKPNILNWPGYVHEKINAGMARILKIEHDKGSLPERFVRYLKEKLPTIRSCVDASVVPPLPGSQGWCLVESDYRTAELLGLAVISGDPNMIRIMTEPDPQFGFRKGGREDNDDDVVRLSYAEGCDIPPENQDPRLLMARKKRKQVLDLVGADEKVPEGMEYKEFALQKMEALLAEKPETVSRLGEWEYLEVTPVSTEDLEKGPDGAILHTRCDLHWMLGEMVNKKPRELMDKKKERGAAKVGNFGVNYDMSPSTLERKIESDTGVKPDEGTGQVIIDAIARRQPVATQFLEYLAGLPASGEFYRAASGRIRHTKTHAGRVRGLDNRTERGILSALGRELRNFPFQESVAATAGRAGKWLLDFGRDHGLHGSPMVILYDSCVVLSPVEEREIWLLAHELFMFKKNGWHYEDRILRYPIDSELNWSWSTRPSKVDQGLLDNLEWCPTPPHLAPVRDWLRAQLEHYQAPEASVAA